jgi:hypothetical protein
MPDTELFTPFPDSDIFISDFAIDGILNNTPVKVVLSKKYFITDKLGGEAGVATYILTATMKFGDVANVKVGDVLVVGAKSYSVIEFNNEGIGLVSLSLSEL